MLATKETQSIIHNLSERSLHHFNRAGIKKESWEISAALIDSALETSMNLNDLRFNLEKNDPGLWHNNSQIAEPLPIPNQFDIDMAGKIQTALLDAADLLPYLALQNNHQLLTSLFNYGLGHDPNSIIIRELTYQYPRTSAHRPLSFRLDTVAGKTITEAQVSMGQLNMDRMTNIKGLLGANHAIIRNFLKINQELTQKSEPTMAIAVEKSTLQYWQVSNDFRLLFSDIEPKCRTYAVSNGGFDYDKQKRKLNYTNSISKQCKNIDTVYTVSDMRRLLTPDMLPLLEAVRDEAVTIQPTLNPLINNYHLLRAILFHPSPRIQALLLNALKTTGCEVPEDYLTQAKEQTLPMILVDPDVPVDFRLLSSDETGVYTWHEIIEDLKSNARNKILSQSLRSKILIRVLLSPDLSLLSGGYASYRLIERSTWKIIEALNNSLIGMQEIRQFNKTDKAIIGIEPLIHHEPLKVSVYDTMCEGKTIQARSRFCPIYMRLPSEKYAKIVSAYSIYSDISARYKLGGEFFAMGGHIHNVC